MGVIAAIVVGVFLGITLSGREDEPEATAPPSPPVGAEVTPETTSEPGEPDGDAAAGEEMTDDSAGAPALDSEDETASPGDEATEDDTAGATAESPPADGPAYTPYAEADYGTEECAPTTGVAEPVLDFGGAPGLCIDTSVPHTAVFDTSAGVVRVALDVTNTPGTVNSFVNLARFGYYDGTLVHRSAPSIGILQGGSPHTNTAADPGPGYTLWDEGTGFTYRPGQLVMARRGDPNSAGAQYFFTVSADAGLLDGQGTYVVFGDVIEGLDVLSDILASHVDQPDNPLGGAPDPPVTVNTLTIEVG